MIFSFGPPTYFVAVAMDEESKARLLRALGIEPRMPDIDRAAWDFYVRPSYPGSPEQETDEIYRMSEIRLIHRLSGIRVSCLVEEDYYGEKAEYVVMSDYNILTRDGRNLQVISLDMTNKVVDTVAGKVSFADILHEPE